MFDLEYEAPQTVAEAVGLLSRFNGQARPLAGGTDLIDQIRVGRHAPSVVGFVAHGPRSGERGDSRPRRWRWG